MMAIMLPVPSSHTAVAAALLLMLMACICVNGQTPLPSPTFTCEGSPNPSCQAQTLTAVSNVNINNGACPDFYYGAVRCPKLATRNTGPFFCFSPVNNNFPLVITYTCPSVGTVSVTFGASSVRECDGAVGAVQLVYGTAGEVIAEARSGATTTATFCCASVGATFSIREVPGSGDAAIKIITAPTITACPASPAPCPCRVEDPTFTCEGSTLVNCKDQTLASVVALTNFNNGVCPQLFYGAQFCARLPTNPPSGPFFCFSETEPGLPLLITYRCPAAGSVTLEFGASQNSECLGAEEPVQLVYGTAGTVIAEAAPGTTRKVTFCCSAAGDTFSIREKRTSPAREAAIRIISAPTIAACLGSGPCSCRVEAPTFTCEDSPKPSCKDQTLATALAVDINNGPCDEFYYGAVFCPKIVTPPASGPFFCFRSDRLDFPLVITYKCPAVGSVSLEFGASSTSDCGGAVGAVQLVYRTGGTTTVIAETTSGNSRLATFCCSAVGDTFSIREKFGSGDAAIRIIAAPTIEPCRVGAPCPCRPLAPPVLGTVNPARYTCVGAPAAAGTACVDQPLAAINALSPEGCQLFYSSAKQGYCANVISPNFLYCYDNRIPPGTDSTLQQVYLCQSTGSVSIGFRSLPTNVCGATGSVTLQPPPDATTGVPVAQPVVVAPAGEAQFAEFCCTANQRFGVSESGTGTSGIEIRQQPVLFQCTEKCPCRIPLITSRVCSCKAGESRKCLSTGACPNPPLQPTQTYLAINAKLPATVQGYDGTTKCAIAIWYETASRATRLVTVNGKPTPCLLEVLPFGCTISRFSQGQTSVSYILSGCTDRAQNTQRVFNYAVCAAGDCCQLGAYLQTAVNRVPTCT